MKISEIALLNENQRHQLVIDAVKSTGLPYKEIWFHGSRASGKHTSTSDWDYLVIVPDDAEYIKYAKILPNLKPFRNADIQPAQTHNRIFDIAKQEGHRIDEAIAPHGSPENELQMFKAGTKPAVLMYDETFDQYYKPLVNKYRWEYVTFDTGESKHYVVAQPGDRQRAERIAKLVSDANKQVFKTGTRIDPNYHRELGTLLGYSKADIDEFIKKVYGDAVTENFKDGKGPGKPGDSQRHGIPKNATIAQLEKAAKAPGRKGQLARWQLNMRRGRKKSLKETRQAAWQWLKKQLPTWPDYVLRDWVYNVFKGDLTGIDPNLELWKMLQGENMSADTQWVYVPNQKFTMSMWNHWTVDRLTRRAGGKIDPNIGVTRDAERHEMQKKMMAQQGGIRSEPVIMKETPAGYELIEGWHRTIQHFAAYPDGYTAPAWIAKM